MMLSASFRMSSWPGWSVCGVEARVAVDLELAPPGPDRHGPVGVHPGEDPVGGRGGRELLHLFLQRADLLLRLGQGLDEPLVLPLGLLELLPALLQARPQQLELPRHLLEPAADLVQLLLEPLHLGLEGVDLGGGFFGASGGRTLALGKLTRDAPHGFLEGIELRCFVWITHDPRCSRPVTMDPQLTKPHQKRLRVTDGSYSMHGVKF